jgi:hypothetical protein
VPGGHDLAVGLDRDAKGAVAAPSSEIGGHPTVPSETGIEGAIGRVARYRECARRASCDDDVSVGLDGGISHLFPRAEVRGDLAVASESRIQLPGQGVKGAC